MAEHIRSFISIKLAKGIEYNIFENAISTNSFEYSKIKRLSFQYLFR